MNENNPEPRAAESEPASDETFLRTWLSDRHETCPLCKYNLRGLTSPRCPECGQLLRLSVSLAEPYLKAWIWLVAGLLPPAGIGAVFVLLFIFEALPHEGLRALSELSDLKAPEAWMLLHVLLCVPLSVAAIGMRGRFLRCRRHTQTALAVFAWIAVFISGVSMLSEFH